MTPPASSASTARTTAARPRHARRAAGPTPVGRRVSGPLQPAAVTTGGSVALPRPGAHPFPARVGRRLRALPDHRLVTRLLTGRVWIPLLAFLLFGIVTMQVHLLKLNTGISRAVEKSARLERENAAMRASIGRLSSGERQRAVALKNGLVDPAAGSARFLTVRSGDANLAAHRIAKPGQTSSASAPTQAVTPVQTETPVVTPTPTTTPTTTPTPTATPTQNVTPAQTPTQTPTQAVTPTSTQQYQQPQVAPQTTAPTVTR
jgi:hypothetical protein